jgi:hypothetical protein
MDLHQRLWNQSRQQQHSQSYGLVKPDSMVSPAKEVKRGQPISSREQEAMSRDVFRTWRGMTEREIRVGLITTVESMMFCIGPLKSEMSR